MNKNCVVHAGLARTYANGGLSGRRVKTLVPPPASVTSLVTGHSTALHCASAGHASGACRGRGHRGALVRLRRRRFVSSAGLGVRWEHGDAVDGGEDDD